jgi:hypothetical protein
MVSVLVALVLGQVSPLAGGDGGPVQALAICMDGDEVSCTKAGCSYATKVCLGGVWKTCTCRDATCNDGNACTTDTYVDATCFYTPVNTSDGNACTTDTCNTTTGVITHTLTCAEAATYLCHDKFGQLTKKVVCVKNQPCDSSCP